MDLTIQFQNYQEGDPGLLESVWVGWKVMALTFWVHAGRQKLQTATVWEAMSWWWWETHIAIPEEERMADELEGLFAEDTQKVSNELIFTTGGVGIGTLTPSQRLRISSNGNVALETAPSRLHINTYPSAAAVGSWGAEGIQIDSSTRPNFLRKIIVQTLLGVKWTPLISPSSQPLYAESSPTRTSSLSPYARLSAL